MNVLRTSQTGNENSPAVIHGLLDGRTSVTTLPGIGSDSDDCMPRRVKFEIAGPHAVSK